VRRRHAASILEVGSGSHGLAYYVKGRPIVGTDIKFRELPEKNMRPVVCSAEALPFRDCSFDLVVSSDMMEQLPAEIRGDVVNDMLRVSRRHLIIGFPSGETAKLHDFQLRKILQKRGKTSHWLEEHVQHEYPTSETIVSALPKDTVRYHVVRNANWRVHQAVVLLQTSYLFNSVISRLRLDTLKASDLLAPILHREPAYREILLIERTQIPSPLSNRRLA
jgi:hypothetical protein